ncbi:hypothetical protein [Bacillus pseudomycoides]|nr:hypothetical protein [Bacillus pseudomycoides]
MTVCRSSDMAAVAYIGGIRMSGGYTDIRSEIGRQTARRPHTQF